MLTSIIVPTYQHAAVLPQAIDSALAQTSPVEVIVVDDGSTDGTAAVLERYCGRIVSIVRPHGGPSAARNAGIDAARGDFVMFLDADDVIAPDKVEQQAAEMKPEIGWVVCDVRIEDAASGRAENASQRYDYAGKALNGWIRDLLAERNYFPIMSPLVRRSVLGKHIRFDDDKVPEDWHFWHAVAGEARVSYLPKVLATYRKSRTGRSRLPKQSRSVTRNVVLPLRLNLGCGNPADRSWHPMAGMVNLDKALGWSFEDGLGDFVAGSVAGITVSHALMYVALADWPRVFREFVRVLAPGGVLRITEDDTTDPNSARLGGWKGSQPAVTLTDAAMVRAHLQAAGLRVYDLAEGQTQYRDGSLRQAQHGAPPNVFFIEGVKPSAVLFSPHADDETLFAAFTLLRHRPRVVICFPSAGDYGETWERTEESRDAVGMLGAGPVEQWDGDELVAKMRELDQRERPERVFAPAELASHPDHVAVARAARAVFGQRVTAFHTYDAGGKVRSGTPAPFEPGWIEHKLRALARYKTQIQHPRAHAFFLEDLREFYE